MFPRNPLFHGCYRKAAPWRTGETLRGRTWEDNSTVLTGPHGTTVLPTWHFSFTLNKKTGLLQKKIYKQERKERQKKGREEGREEEDKERGKESPGESTVISWCLWVVKLWSAVPSSSFSFPAAGHSFAAFPNSMSL